MGEDVDVDTLAWVWDGEEVSVDALGKDEEADVRFGV
jgi:hypothetical protein